MKVNQNSLIHCLRDTEEMYINANVTDHHVLACSWNSCREGSDKLESNTVKAQGPRHIYPINLFKINIGRSQSTISTNFQ
jgi:hypothetical protein